MSDPIVLDPGAGSLDVFHRVLSEGAPVVLADGARENVDRASDLVARAAAGKAPYYGVNTGFGKLAQTRISPEDTETLQRNLILSHSAGVGPILPEAETRLLIALKINSLGRGASGVRWPVLALMQDLLARRVTPVIPMQGSVGASGDLAPLAHLAAVLIGEGEAFYDGERMPGGAALAKAGLTPVVLAAKEGLGLINGTQFSTAVALAAFYRAADLFNAALITGALATDAAMGSAAPFRPEIHALRSQPGQIAAAMTLRALLEDSEIRESHREDDERVQDPYCIRCQPQVMGACLDLLTHISGTLEREANAVTDNPLVFPDTGEILSGGNFHAEPVAFAADQMALAIAEIGSIAQRRVAMLVDPALSYGLPPFLTPKPGVNSGFMIAEVTSAALQSENKQKAAPASIDSTPTSANQEDHVSMAAHGACRLLPMLDNLAGIVGIELLIAGQGVDLRGPLKTSPALQRVLAHLRARIPMLQEDRYMAPDLEAARVIVAGGDLPGISGIDGFPKFGGVI